MFEDIHAVQSTNSMLSYILIGNTHPFVAGHRQKKASLVAQTVKKSTCNAGDPGSMPGLGKSLGEGNGNPLQYSCLGNSMDRGAWQATVHGIVKNQTQLSD